MSIIRNGGFERGNIDFWTVETDGSLEISTLLPKYGSYCGKYTAGATATEFIMNNDYITVNPFDLMGLLGWAKSITTRQVYPCLYIYDADYSYIGSLLGMSRAMDGTYININTQIPIPEGVEYVRAGYRIQTAADEVFYFDGYSANVFSADKVLSGNVLLGDFAGITTSGNTATDKKDLQMYKTFEADLIVTYIGSAGDTLDVVIYEINQNYDKQVVGTFTQTIVETQERITLTHCTGRQLYVEYVVGGTSSSFYFKVAVAGKR